MYMRIPQRMKAVCLAGVLVACGGKTDGASASPPSGTQPPTGGQATSSAGSPSPPYAAAQIASARAACGEPHGPVHPYQDAASELALLEGAWLFCGPQLQPGTNFQGMEFLPDGRFYYLAPDANGDLVPAQGIKGEGSYKIEPFPQYDVFFADGTLIAIPSFEDSPTRLEQGDNGTYFVTLGL
jgi:hypothetical protein